MNRWNRNPSIDGFAVAVKDTFDDHETRIINLQAEVEELKKIIHSYMHPDHPDS